MSSRRDKLRTVRNWRTPENIALLSQVIGALRDGVLEPERLGRGAPLDLRGLTFPTVEQIETLALLTSDVHVLKGRQEFTDATVRQVDFERAQLGFSVWNNCQFDNVRFDRARLEHVRFFGCIFSSCSFRRSLLTNAVFSVGRNGSETRVVSAVFADADFRGASFDNPVLQSTRFERCRLDGFVFNGASCEGVTFVGQYKELTFRGVPGDSLRNRLNMDLSRAEVTWVHADGGLDFSEVELPIDGSCVVISERRRSVDVLCRRLPTEQGALGERVAKVLRALYSDRAISPLDDTQEMVLISNEMLADFAETSNPTALKALMGAIRSIAKSEGFLVR